MRLWAIGAQFVRDKGINVGILLGGGGVGTPGVSAGDENDRGQRPPGAGGRRNGSGLGASVQPL